MIALITFLASAVAEAHAPCSSTPPGFQLFTRGYDLSTLDLLNPQSLGWKKTLLVDSCDSGTTYVNDYNGRTYSVPDQLSGQPLNVAGDVTKAFTLLSDNSQSFKEKLAVTIGESAFFGLFSSSQTASESFSLLTSEYVFAGVRSSHMSAYQMSLHESFRTDIMNLSSDCQFLVDQLPTQFDESSFSAYEQLINICGTHYLDTGIFGCKFQYRHFTAAGKLDAMAEGDVNINAGLDFFGFLSASGAVSGHVEAASQSYLAISMNETSCFGGGSACPYSADTFSSWLKECPNEPAFISGSFKHNSELIRNTDVAKSFKLAVSNHFNRAFLKDEFIPLLKTTVSVVSMFPPKDSGGSCTTPHQCPTNVCRNGYYCCAVACYSRCDGCTNPRVGPSQSQMDETVNDVTNNMTAWTGKIEGIIQQAETVLGHSNIVSNITVAALTAEFVFYISHIQQPFVTEQCGYTLERACCDAGGHQNIGFCQSGNGHTYLQRTISYLQGLSVH
jgi:hypothetical protein